jgi:excisionase family DNA binding protein
MAVIPPSPSRFVEGTMPGEHRSPGRPMLFTAQEVAELLRTSRKTVYAMVDRRQLPGVTRLGRRVLFRSDLLLDWLRQKSTPSLER